MSEEQNYIENWFDLDFSSDGHEDLRQILNNTIGGTITALENTASNIQEYMENGKSINSVELKKYVRSMDPFIEDLKQAFIPLRKIGPINFASNL